MVDGVMRVRPGAPVKPVPFVIKDDSAKPEEAKAPSTEKAPAPDKPPAVSDRSGPK